MRVIRYVADCPAAARGAVVALGNFDGVHRGHQHILAHSVQMARQYNCPAAVMSFVPHPRAFFAPQRPSQRLMGMRQKLQAFARAGVDVVYLVRFNSAFASLTAADFLQRILHDGLAAKHIVTGFNFAFGKGRGGDIRFLAAHAPHYHMGFTACEPVMDGDAVPISSSAIRAALADGHVTQARQMLGHDYVISGRVIRGQQQGRRMGVPTANVAIAHLFQPRYGVYAAWVRIGRADVAMPAVVNIGVRPTVDGQVPLLEAHMLEQSADLYGTRLDVALVDFIRPERRFDAMDALKAQIQRDIDDARVRLAR